MRTGTLPAASGRPGYKVVPVETMAVDTNAYTSATGRPGRKLATLLPKGAVLSKTGAKLRRVKSGGKLKLDGNRTVKVSGVVDDALLGGYEVALERTLARRYGIQRAAYLLVRPRGPGGRPPHRDPQAPQGPVGPLRHPRRPAVRPRAATASCP